MAERAGDRTVDDPLARAREVFRSEDLVGRYPELNRDSVQAGLLWARFAAVQQSLKEMEASTKALVGRVNKAMALSRTAQEDSTVSGEAIVEWAQALGEVGVEIGKRRKGPEGVVAAISQLQALTGALSEFWVSPVGVTLKEMVESAIQQHWKGLVEVTSLTRGIVGGLRRELERWSEATQGLEREEKQGREGLAELNARYRGLAREVDQWLQAFPRPVTEEHSNAIADVRQALADRIEPAEEIGYLAGSFHPSDPMPKKLWDFQGVVAERDAIKEQLGEGVSQLRNAQEQMQALRSKLSEAEADLKFYKTALKLLQGGAT